MILLKEAGGNSEVKELIADFENIVKHVQDHGQCSSPNIEFENKIEQENQILKRIYALILKQTNQ